MTPHSKRMLVVIVLGVIAFAVTGVFYHNVISSIIYGIITMSLIAAIVPALTKKINARDSKNK